MNENNEVDLDRKASKTKTAAFLIITGIILLAGITFVRALGDSSPNPMMERGLMPSTDQQQSADPVKESTGPNSDTMPSPTGTGPGSENSLLSQ